MKNIKWSKRVPESSGWYWCRYSHPTKGLMYAPAHVFWSKELARSGSLVTNMYNVTPAIGPCFNSLAPNYRFLFGPKIEEPF